MEVGNKINKSGIGRSEESQVTRNSEKEWRIKLYKECQLIARPYQRRDISSITLFLNTGSPKYFSLPLFKTVLSSKHFLSHFFINHVVPSNWIALCSFNQAFLITHVY
jgi:hypothetical protein